MRSWNDFLLPVTGLFVAVGSAACGEGDENTPMDGVSTTPVTVSATLGPAGGTLETTADDGTVYTLTIPADAIPSGITIEMTPIATLDGFPLASGVEGGVELGPSGTVFAAPVTLEITNTRMPSAGEFPLAILFSEDEPALEPSIAGSTSGISSIPMTHFSGATVGFATAQELQGLAGSGDATCLVDAVLPAFADPPDVATVHAVYDGCFQSDVLPLLEGATTDVQLATALGMFSMWKIDTRGRLGPQLFTSYDDIEETSLYFDVLVGKLQEAVARDNQLCEESESLAALANVLFWQTQAARFGLDTVAHLLDRGTILRDLCAQPVIDTIVIPDDLDVGFPYSLDLQVGLLFTGQAESQGVPFEVQLTGDGLDIQNPTGFTDAQGVYTSVITPTRSGTLSVDVTACFVYPGTQTASDVCVLGNGSSDAIDLTGIWVATVYGYPVCVNVAQNQNAISGTVHQFGGKAALLATLAGGQLLNVSVNGFFAEANCDSSGTGTATAETFTLNVLTEAPCEEVPFTYNFTRGSDCP